MKPRIEKLSTKLCIGKRLRMSLAKNRTAELWQSFMRQRKLILNSIGTDLYSLQVYDAALDFKNFNPTVEFDKWALIEVKDFDTVPDKMEKFTLAGGLYAVFIHKGLPSEFARTFNYIFKEWLPKSDYLLDNRPHFEVLGNNYSNTNPNSEEEVWVPIKPK